MEQDVGIVGYATSAPGVGGTVKSAPEDFVVEEIPSAPPPSPDGPYAIATLRVRNWETNRLVREVARALRISRRRIGYAGTKDKRAVTTQLVSFEGVAPEAVRALHLGDVEVLDAYAAGAPLELGDLRGFPSFFGVQRFGSVRPITHIVGRHIVRGEFDEAVNAYVANPLDGEDPESYGVRAALRDTGDVRAAL